MPADHPHHHATDRQSHADCAAARTFAYLRAAGIPPPETPAERITSTWIDDGTGWQVVVVLTRWDGPPRLHLVAELPAAGPPLTDVQQAALEAAPGPATRPVTVRALARLAGYGANSHFYEAVRVLIERGLLVKVRGGVRRP